jgi:hypothetical protein
MSKNTKQTSQAMASMAAEVLRDENASAIAKSLAGSVLSQTHSDKQTGAALEEKAGRVLESDKYSETTRALAASVVSQSNKSR